MLKLYIFSGNDTPEGRAGGEKATNPDEAAAMDKTNIEDNKDLNNPEPGSQPHLFVFFEEKVDVFTLNGEQSFGRRASNSNPDLAVNALTVSRRHGTFKTDKKRVHYVDEGSSNGTILNNESLTAYVPVPVNDGSCFRIHAVNSSGSDHDVVMVLATDTPDNTKWTKISLQESADRIEVGRGQEISLRGRTVSRKHAIFVRAQNGWAIVDNHSLNGVYLNGKRISEPVLLHPMDVIRIAKHIFLFRNDYIMFQEDEAPSQKDVWKNRPQVRKKERADSRPLAEKHSENLPKVEISPGREGARKSSRGKKLTIRIEERSVWVHLHKKKILCNVNLQVSSGSLVLILGGSGAGKTTFMNAVMGYEPARGSILYGKSDIYREFEKMKYEIGYVPQDDLLRMDDVVYDTLENAARMRLPEVITDDQRERRVQETLQMFGLSSEREQLVGKLSGGQRKRLSIAVEYIGNPSLFFLDEPDSGLDGIASKELMQNLREIADQNKIVMVISHVPDRAFDLFDKVVVLAKSEQDDCGHLIYYGSPTEGCRFFGTNTLEGIVGRVNRREEGGEGLADYYMRIFNAQRVETGRL